MQEPEPFLILILEKTLVTGASSVILIVLGPSRTFWSATSQESVHQMDVVEMMILECAVGHVRKSSCRVSLSQEVLAAKPHTDEKCNIFTVARN